MNAIVIDDSRAMRGILARVLTNAGFTVAQAADGRQALDALLATPGAPPALAMVDWNMPVMNGLDFIRAIRCDKRFASMRIVMVTTEVETHQMAAALEAGADEYVMKPFTDVTIREKLALLGLGDDKAAA